MSSFEEDFPSLKGRRIQKLITAKYGEIKIYDLAFSSHPISCYCLDKQRVKEVIDKLKDTETGLISSYDLKKELNLE